MADKIEVARVPDMGLDKASYPKQAPLQGTLAFKMHPAHTLSSTRPQFSPAPKLYDPTLIAAFEITTDDDVVQIEFWSCHAKFNMEGEHFDRTDHVYCFAAGDLVSTGWTIFGESWLVFPGSDIVAIEKLEDSNA